MKFNFLKITVVFLFLSVSSLGKIANAALITTNTMSNGTVIDFSQFNNQLVVGSGIQVGSLVGEDVLLTAFEQHRIGVINNHGLGSNGNWGNKTAALNNSYLTGYMTFWFNDGPVSAVGGLVNYAPSYGQYIIEAIGAGDIVLESYNVTSLAPISTPQGINADEFRGIARSANDIYGFRLKGAFNVIDDLTFDRVKVPEPSTLAIFALGMIGLASRRFKK